MKMSLNELDEKLQELRKEFGETEHRHIKTGGEYRIRDFGLNVLTDEFDVIYSPVEQESILFTRNWNEFQDGRFEAV